MIFNALVHLSLLIFVVIQLLVLDVEEGKFRIGQDTYGAAQGWRHHAVLHAYCFFSEEVRTYFGFGLSSYSFHYRVRSGITC